MSTSSSLPDLDEAVDCYLAVWRRYGDDPFTADALLSEFEAHQHGIDPATVDVPAALDLLTAYGLLDREDGEYWVRCRPDEDVDAWLEQQERRIERLHRAVRTAREESPDAGNGGSEQYLGEQYAPVAFDDVDDAADLLARATESLSGDERAARLVVRAPGTAAGEVQDVVDRSERLEKVGSAVEGDDPDDLEFRMYLRVDVDEE
ncbi:hypothetical protein [Halomicrococcus gelatinilyticus]|uniref:hypothetical protein n=1 Tax=Halomicrococcus gelatinilyticus TaxID=1702103 RepID=UPI002E0D78A9